MGMSTRVPVSTESLLLPIRSPVIWETGALSKKTSRRLGVRNVKNDHTRTSGQLTVSGSRLRAVSSPIDTDAHEPQLAADNVRAILFDMDGVLCNSEEMTQRVGAETLLKVYGVTVDPDEFRAFAGMGEAYFLSGVAGKYGIQIDDIDKLKEIFYAIYLEKAADPTEDIGLPGAIELVKACREAGLKVAVASSADRVKVDANLKLVGFNAKADFDAIVSADLFERLKPAPDIFLAAAREVGVEHSACVVVEDAAAGVQAARAAGMRVVGVTTTLPREEMLAQEPDEVRPAIADIDVNLLQGLQWARRAEMAIEDRTDSGRGAGPSDDVRA